MLPRWIYGILWVGLSLGVSTGLSACAANVPPSNQAYTMASLDGMPAKLLAAPIRVQQAYQFAVANPEIAKQIPCYCGCAALAHTSSYDCYVSSVSQWGEITYDWHAVNCGICVDITQDTMRLLDSGQSPSEIKAYIDKTYARVGLSTGP